MKITIPYSHEVFHFCLKGGIKMGDTVSTKHCIHEWEKPKVFCREDKKYMDLQCKKCGQKRRLLLQELEFKICSKCGVKKKTSSFYKYKKNHILINNIPFWIGMRCHSQCKECEKKRKRERKIQMGTTQKTKNNRTPKFGMNYVFNFPINGLHKCKKCGRHKPYMFFTKRPKNKSSYQYTCRECDNKRKKLNYKKNFFISYKKGKSYKTGDGCCLYCGEINPFMLNNHHIFGRKNSDFTITLCENCHASFTRRMWFVLKAWNNV